ncbi:MAG: acyltransferase [Myxococcota bacterium]
MEDPPHSERSLSNPPARLHSVQVLRAVAALAVLGWHAVWVTRAFPEALPALPAFLAIGYAGVDLFFVLSGFIVCHITAGRQVRFGGFVLRRWVRIVPLYAVFTGLALFAVALHPAWDGKGTLSFGYALASFTVWPMRETPYLDVGWSLEHELIFYALAGACFAWASPRVLLAAVLSLFGVGLVVHVGSPTALAGLWDGHVFSLFHVQFAIGVAIAQTRPVWARFGHALPILLGVGLALATGAWLDGTGAAIHPTGAVGLVRVLGFGFAGGALLVGALNTEARAATGAHRFLSSRGGRAAIALGDASFVLYLSHYFVFSIVSKLATGAPAAWAIPTLVLATALACGFAWAFHVAVEAPFLRRARAHLTPEKPPAHAASTPTAARAWAGGNP